MTPKEMRETLHQTINDVLDGSTPVEEANAVTNLAREINNSIGLEWEELKKEISE